MLRYTARRLFFALPTLLAISLVVFALLELAPGDPMAQVPQTISAEVRAQMREALGLGEAAHIRYIRWLYQLAVVEPMVGIDALFGTTFSEGAPRLLSWQTRAPVMTLLGERLPQTLIVVGLAYVIGVVLAIPLGVWSAYRRGGAFDRMATGAALLGYAVPPFFSGAVLIWLFAIMLGWLPSVYDTGLIVRDWDSLVVQIRQMALPVLVLSVQTTAQISRYMRAAMLDALGQDYITAARARGAPEGRVLMAHGLRNSLIPVVSIVAVGAPQIFAGAIVTEQIFGVNGIGALLVSSVQATDIPTIMAITMALAALIVTFNLLADLAYGWLDPRVRYD